MQNKRYCIIFFKKTPSLTRKSAYFPYDMGITPKMRGKITDDCHMQNAAAQVLLWLYEFFPSVFFLYFSDIPTHL